MDLPSHRWSTITLLRFASDELFNFQAAFMKLFLVLKSFAIRQSNKFLVGFGINVDSEIDCLSIEGIGGNTFQLI
jgi:hypothetical protein